MKNIPNLVENKGLCCGCGTCSAVCPKGAIMLKEDALGFRYPEIDAEKCIACHLCEKHCNYKNNNRANEPMKVYAGISEDKDFLMRSSSGGIFSALASAVLEQGGIVFGALQKVNADGEYVLVHQGIEKLEDLSTITGSKYYQSSTVEAFEQVKQHLQEGRKVLFCGTPCQVDGLYGYVGKEHSDLFTVDILCHGVPSAKMFNEYISKLQEKYKAERIEFAFRDKQKNGWQHGAVITVHKKNGKPSSKKISPLLSSYYTAFMRGYIERDSCYSCKFANEHRPGDLTLGDFWGVQKEHPDILQRNGGELDEENGISCILVNTENGIRLLEMCEGKLKLFPSSFEKASRKNPTLNHPLVKPNDRDAFVAKYIQQGYLAAEEMYQRKYGSKKLLYLLKNMIPNKIKRALRGK